MAQPASQLHTPRLCPWCVKAVSPPSPPSTRKSSASLGDLPGNHVSVLVATARHMLLTCGIYSVIRQPIHVAKWPSMPPHTLSAGPGRMFPPPFRTGTTHVVQLRAIRGGERRNHGLSPIRRDNSNSSNTTHERRHLPKTPKSIAAAKMLIWS